MFLEFAALIKENSKPFTMEFPKPTESGGAEDFDDLGNPIDIL